MFKCALHVFVQKFRGVIRSIFPDDSIQLRITAKPAKNLYVSQRIKHFSIQIVRQIDFAFRTIVELEPDDIIVQIFRIFNMQEHNITPMGRSNAFF